MDSVWSNKNPLNAFQSTASGVSKWEEVFKVKGEQSVLARGYSLKPFVCNCVTSESVPANITNTILTQIYCPAILNQTLNHQSANHPEYYQA